MNFIDKIRNRIETVRLNTIEAAGGLAKLKASGELQAARLEICNSCEFLFQPTSQCTKCGCFVTIKSAINQARCPLNKWPVILKTD